MNTSINNFEELLAHAHELETQAAERYEEMAEQMEVHNNPELAELFQKMAVIEQKHVDQVETLATGVELPRLAPWDYGWQDSEAPENVPVGQGHYQMTPYQALSLMIDCEERAFTFFKGVAQQTLNPKVRDLATELAQEEQHHAELLREWLGRYPEPETDWYEDMDEPIDQG